VEEWGEKDLRREDREWMRNVVEGAAEGSHLETLVLTGPLG
jgi:hypothetical protein